MVQVKLNLAVTFRPNVRIGGNPESSRTYQRPREWLAFSHNTLASRFCQWCAFLAKWHFLVAGRGAGRISRSLRRTAVVTTADIFPNESKGDIDDGRTTTRYA